MSFERACALADVPADEALAVTIDRYDVAIARNGDEVFALQDLCSHAAVSLSEGEVADCTIECWLHGSTFDLRTGKPTTFPATEPVATFPVEIRDGDVYVDVESTLNGVTPA
ncbi:MULTISPECIES: non-heme iron oxygenase ferredoxin subunit [unclassified Nocardioides]|uniref:non-heme iron oxygenase ferredoxin subunit n=1 Tax=unclassified Nocardioides TaxID=2615069 RepID=UPI0007000972|nr:MULTISPECIES: non-heme iron oxygenase ferredoxin subunit [unclassified Nocardioides]KRA32816.1 2Fe-2S ferredoxin [Nocardioides sp. Root614]KRA89470.1 2Fe-2S ferredoxin [Nocardioides sp. Root682]